MKVDVTNCARCEMDHVDLEFQRLPNAADEWEYWAMCPNTNAPILMRVVSDNPPVDPRLTSQPQFLDSSLDTRLKKEVPPKPERPQLETFRKWDPPTKG
jgi:hypothetical protein